MQAYCFERLAQNPIVHAALHPSIGDSVCGPSLIKVPDWVPGPLGRYYLYFAHHEGDSIRLAVADNIAGPWRVHEPGAFRLEQSGFDGHIASPDALVLDDLGQIRLYFHGCLKPGKDRQFTCMAMSANGLDFELHLEILGPQYFRVFRYRKFWYALAMPGRVFRSRDGLSKFEAGPDLLDDNTRHSAVLVNEDELLVFYSKWGDCPERIKMRTIALGDDWQSWKAGPEFDVLRPDRDWEGSELPLVPSRIGAALQAKNQLRDPCLYREGGELFLLYACAGEQGIGIARAPAGSGASSTPHDHR